MIVSRKFGRRLVSAVIASVVAVLSFASVAQATERISVLNGFDGPVNAISEPDGSGTRYFGGNFTLFQPWDTGSGALVEASSGDVNATFPKVTGGSISATAADGSGGFYIGGSFRCIGPNTSGSCDGVDDFVRNRAAHINADGSVDPSWNPNLNSTVQAIGVLGSTVYLGGAFTTAGDTPRNFAAAVGTNGTLTSWNPNLSGTRVNAIGVLGSTVYLGGYFTTVGGTPRNNAAAITTGGTLDLSWDPNLSHGVLAIGVLGSTVYLGGQFSTADGAPRNSAAAVTTGGTLTDWNPNLGGGNVRAIGVLGSTVYLGGYFNTVGGTPRNFAAAVDDTVGTPTSWNPNLNETVVAIGVLGSTVYLGGYFTTAGGTPRNYAAAVTTGGTLTDWNPNPNSTVLAIGVLGSTVYLGGDFTIVGGTTRNRAAALDTDGNLTDWNPNLSSGFGNSSVSAIGVLGSTVYLGGYFTTVGGTPRNYAAAVTTGGTLVTSWNPNLNGPVFAIGVSGSTVYLGGEFTCIGPNIEEDCSGGDYSVRNYAAAVTTGGTLTDWNPNLDDAVSAIGVLGSTVYLGGGFTRANGGADIRNKAAAVDTDGTLTDWNPNLNSTVNAIGVLGSTVYLGGYFTTVGGTPRNKAAAVDTDGTLTDWNPNLNSTVNAIGAFGSTVYLGGAFTTAGGTPRSRVTVVPSGYFNLEVSKSGTGGGTVTSSPAGIDCGEDCSEILVGGTSVTLTATPAAGSSFTSWSGGCTGTSSTCVLTLNAATSVTAIFGVTPTPTPTPTPAIPTSTPVKPEVTSAFKVLSVKAWPQKITTQLNLPGPGKVAQVGTTRLSTRRQSSQMAKTAHAMTVCTAKKTVAKAGTVTITCRLSAKARAARKTQSLTVRLVTTFTTTGGTAKSVSKTLVLKTTQYRPPPVTG